jgi:hypothetical protein
MRRLTVAFFSWTLILLGVMTFVGGGVLLGWSLFTERAELWRIGLPMALIGQAGLLFGFLLNLESIWQNSRESKQSLDEIDRQISDLKKAATMLTTTHSSSAQSFYSHFANGANPHMLLADLKGQLDVLATKLANEQR